jgi:hypothetical protein
MNPEDRLRTALHDVADSTPVDPGSYDRIERKAATARRRRRVVGGGLAAALVVVGVAVPLALRDDSQSVQTGPASDSRDTTTTTPNTTAPPAEAPGVGLAGPFVWPSDDRFRSAEAVVLAFAEEYLGVVGPSAADNGDSSFIVRPQSEGSGRVRTDGPRTIVETATAEGRYWVVGAVSPNIQVAAPAANAGVSSPATVSGQARNLYEGNVIVEVRDGSGAVLGTNFTTAAGSGPELAPFSTEVSFDEGVGPIGAVVVKSDSGLGGTPEATVVPVDFGATSATTEVTVFLVDDSGDFVPVTREVPRTTGVLRAALLELLEGATPEEQAQGLSSPFDDHGDLLRGVTITEGDRAVVDLDPNFGSRIPNSSTSAMSTAILGSLDRTVFQFPNVLWVSYRFGGECGTFGEIDPAFLCEPRTRDQY